MKLLPLMHLVAPDGDYATKMKAFVQQRQSYLFGALVRFVCADKRFDLLSKKSTYRHGLSSGKYFRFSNHVRVKAWLAACMCTTLVRFLIFCPHGN